MTCEPPPARCQKQWALGRCDEFGLSSPDRTLRALAKSMLLQIGPAENGVAGRVQENDPNGAPKGKIVDVMDKVLCLDRIGEWQPDQISPAEHPSEVLVLDVPCREDRLLVEEAISDVP